MLEYLNTRQVLVSYARWSNAICCEFTIPDVCVYKFGYSLYRVHCGDLHGCVYCLSSLFVYRCQVVDFVITGSSLFLIDAPRAGSGVVRIDPLRFLAGCRTSRLNQALSVLSFSLGFFWICDVLLTIGTLFMLLFLCYLCVLSLGCSC